MAFREIALRLNGDSKTRVHVGYRNTTISITAPTKRLAKQLVRAAYGKKARIVGGRNEA